MARSSNAVLLAVLTLAGWANCRNRAKHQAQEAMVQRPVEVNFRIIRYWEGDEFLQLTWEPRPGKPPLAYVPSERLWDEMMPDWAVRRRHEIMQTIKRETAYMRFVWQEYDSVP